MEDLLDNEAFAYGIAVGICIHQQKVVSAHQRNEPVKIGDELYYLQSGRERLEEFMDKVCK